jgi:hypothetical protein
MAYALNYTLTQKLRDNTNLTVNIYGDGYSGSPYIYKATDISIAPNSNEEDPMAVIISSQMNVSFVISTSDDYTNFPDLLTYNDTKYYVELLINGYIKWKGFIINDYIEVNFTTGFQTVNLNCVDGISFLKNYTYNSTASINDTVKVLDIIGEALSTVVYNSSTSIYACCSYFANGMSNRGASTDYEPFNQSYLYRRDFLLLDYYTLLENIVTSFGCRLFQNNGDWYILPMNQMATTVFYTKYSLSTTPTLQSSGTLSNSVTIAPYSAGNVHFIGNSQVKIVRKGYPNIVSTIPYSFAKNYIHNYDLKQYTGSFPSLNSIGWTYTHSSPGQAQLAINDDYQFNSLSVTSGAGGWGQAVTGDGSTYAYLPIMFGPEVDLSFDFYSVNDGDKIKVAFQLYYWNGSSYTTYYLNSSDIWQTTIAYKTITTSQKYAFTSQTVKCYLGPNVISGTQYNLSGYLRVIFRADDYGGGVRGGYVRNIVLTQVVGEIESERITRSIGTSKTTKDISLPYGAIYPTTGTSYQQYDNLGMIVNSSGVMWQDWYRYGHGTEAFYDLPRLIMRQYSNLLNKNIATLEGDLGTYNSANGMNYLDKTYTITDSSTNAMSYNGRKFMANRLTVVPYTDNVNSLQLIEVSDTDTGSTEKIEYINNPSQTTQATPRG